MQQATATAMTKETWAEVSRLFQIKISPYVLKDYPDAFNLLARFADKANPNLPADAGKWVEAMHAQLKAHLYDNNPRLFYWEPGKEPPLVTKTFAPKTHVSHLDEIEQVEKEAEEFKVQAANEKVNQQAKEAIPALIDGFQPIFHGKPNYAAQQRVQAALREYIAKCEVSEAQGNKVNWISVKEKVETYIDKEYDAAEGRGPGSDRL